MPSNSLVTSESATTSNTYSSVSFKLNEPFIPSNSDIPMSALARESSSNNSTGSYRTNPLAIVLRLRVTQIVCGIMTTVLGAVACIEERGSFRIGTGVVAGLMSVTAAIASIRATINNRDYIEDRTRWIIQYIHAPAFASAKGDCHSQSMLLSALWGMAVVSNMVMLAFVFISAFPSANRNLIIIGALEFAMGAIVLAIFVINIYLAIYYRG
ncbi:hypothetical protein CHUAL_010357 [Chamberlinius hualienensis]